MLKLFITGLFLSALIFTGCHSPSKEKEKKDTPATRSGFFIDSTIRQSALNKIDTALKIFSSASLDMTYYQNDKEKDVMFVNGEGLPHFAMYQYQHDSIEIVLGSPMNAWGSFLITVYKDSATVSYVYGSGHSTRLFKLNRNDSDYTTSLNVSCRFYLVLNKRKYKANEHIFGYIEAASNDFYQKNESFDSKDRLEFKGYFNAMSMDSMDSMD